MLPGMRFLLPALLLLAMLIGACENEGRSDEARQTVAGFLAALAGGSDDFGWSLLNGDARESLDADEYGALALAAVDEELVAASIELLYEDDGFYDFAVTFRKPIPPGYAELLALENEFGNSL